MATSSMKSPIATPITVALVAHTFAGFTANGGWGPTVLLGASFWPPVQKVTQCQAQDADQGDQ